MNNPFYKLDTFKVEVCHAVFGDSGDVVAVYEARTQLIDALGAAYKATQNVHSGWVETKGQFNVTVEPKGRAITQNGCRSTSIGDFMLVTDSTGKVTRWSVESGGFAEGV